MVLDEDTLEAMLARGRSADSKPVEMVTTDETDEFEVYERQTSDEPEPESPPVAQNQQPARQPADDDFEVFERHSEPEPEAPAVEPVEPEPVEAETIVEDPFEMAPEPNQPAVEPQRRRPEVWPPITRRSPEPVAAPEPVAVPAEPEPARPEPVVQRTHAPAPATVAATPTGNGARIAILQATFNIELTDMMAELAKQKAAKLGADVVAHEQCPGVYDLPLPTKRLLARDDVDGVVVIGVVVQGETKHDEVITHATAKTLQELSLQFDKPVGLAITGPGMTWAQAEARVVNAAHGVEAVLALLSH